MRISEDEQTCGDFDWYCVDDQGQVGHFTSAGFKRLPPTVEASAEDLNFLDRFFEALVPIPEAHRVDERLARERRSKRYLDSFVSMADRGLFSFDIETYLRPGICYFRVALPLVPLRFVDLPDQVKEVLGRTVLKGRLLEECSEIPYAETLTI